ncbi:Gfo/Idh/MocA family protein [Tropicimonas sp. IMCC6043]|uniref:Gfo/Idh/MocA family protein n=1 Tax=Tropicimonas sp. IMCC6043 TaxID=2510645 RepID=UPI0013E9FC55|nr:Gfo/Idh/MocA family oxidoreductase [Tropicimonas sp. IMCC6043]
MRDTSRTIGAVIIGAGERGVYFIGSRIAEAANGTPLRIVGVQDLLPDRTRLAAAHLDALYAEAGVAHRVAVFDGLDAALAHPDVDLAIVTTHTDNHRQPVERAVAAGKRVYLDKPISVTLEDALAISEAESQSGQPIMMGFTRRYEQPWIESVELARSGRIGTPRMVLLRSVIPYTRYLQLWHRTGARSGGALNDKGSHHFDVLNWIAAGARPLRVTATGGRSGIFAPDPDAPERCRDCDRDCPYRRHETLIDRFEGVARVPNASWVDAAAPDDRNDTCVYRPGADIDDHAVVTVQYDSGLVATLFFTIFGPWSEDQETLEIIGDSGRLRMERHSGDIDLVERHGHARSVIRHPDPDRGSSHYGADRALVRHLLRFMKGERPPVGVAEGVASLRLVRAAQLSLANAGTPVDPMSGDVA